MNKTNLTHKYPTAAYPIAANTHLVIEDLLEAFRIAKAWSENPDKDDILTALSLMQKRDQINALHSRLLEAENDADTTYLIPELEAKIVHLNLDLFFKCQALGIELKHGNYWESFAKDGKDL